ncbi:ABC transporter permease [Janthinobacterium fluminis]|uniref:ABC transporter permease n=1 Tax=Janthinobacterium fluminis TaxID=2987524 RepID=A0ABT5JWU6_9BURK|nr:ABC transporter permease [Janthinobacterium fluminis]MDC8757201.1 ABC transporter permease [Janthinobacterium fluminis]
MTLRNFRVGWRTLVQEPAYSLVVVVGLGVGLAAALLLLGFVRYSLQYNAHVPGVDSVYVVKQRFNVDPSAPSFDQVPLLLRAAAATAPGVASVTGYIPTRPEGNGLTVKIDGQLRSLPGLTVLPGFTEMLGLTALRGNLKLALEQPDSVVISEEAARRLFGTPEALGKTMQAEGKLLRVGAVLNTPQQNTTIPFQALVGVNSVLVDEEMRDELLSGRRGWWGKLLVRVRPGASPPAIGEALQQVVDRTPGIQNQPPEIKQRLGKRKVMELELAPLRDAYFDTKVAGNHIAAPGDRANPLVVAALAAIAVLILALASINYVNLAAVRIVRRQREVAIRKVLGAGVPQIVLQLLAESMLVALLATGLGLMLAWLALPIFSELVHRKLDSLLTASNIAMAMAIGAMLGALAAAYPAWIAIRVHPGQALGGGKPETESRQGMYLRRVLTVLQLATAMSFASLTLGIAWQTHFAMRVSAGFDAASMLIVDLPEPVRHSAVARNFIAALSAQAGGAGVAISEDAVGRHRVAWMRDMKRPSGASAAMDMKSVSANFFEQYGLRAESGRLFDPRIDREDDPVPLVLNAIAARELGFATSEAALGEEVLFTGFDGKVLHKRVVGIVPELRFGSLREAPHAVAYELWTAGTTLSVRAREPLAQLEARIQALWPRYFPDSILSMHRAADILAANYAEDARMAKLLAIATGIALAIAAFGTYVLSAYTVQRRAKEIVLRMLHGAGRADIGLLVAREIGGLTLVSAVLALPLAGVVVQRYLSFYVERAPIGYWPLLIALAATSAIASCAVARHVWVAMRMRPAAPLYGG